MGRPRLYSAEVPLRCQALIDLFGAAVEADSDPHGRWGGPLKTTFLVAMATPMIVLPIERIFKQARANNEGVADDRELDPRLAAMVIDNLGPAKTFGAAPFFEPDVWSYVPTLDPFEVANDWPAEVLDELHSAAGAKAAVDAPAQDILLALRNALGHGGVTYLDENGRHAKAATNMLGFASFARSRHPELRLLRVTVPGFEAFLRLWSEWLASRGVGKQLEERGPGHFDYAAE
jgi:hypothetical protein